MVKYYHMKKVTLGLIAFVLLGGCTTPATTTDDTMASIPYAADLATRQIDTAKQIEAEIQNGKYTIDSPYIQVDPYGLSPLSVLVAFANEEAGMGLDPLPATVEPGSADLFNYPFVHLTGHGNVVFSPAEVQNLRTYLCGGGFLHIDDNYGLDKFIRREMKKVFPETDFAELPASHPLFKQAFDFSSIGLPKIHEHDNKRPQAFALFHEGRMVCLYTYECDLGDGWESPEVHGDKEETHRKALEMGVNILQFVFMQ